MYPESYKWGYKPKFFFVRQTVTPSVIAMVNWVSLSVTIHPKILTAPSAWLRASKFRRIALNDGIKYS